MIIKALLIQKNKLLGFKFKIVTNHEALRYLKTQQKLPSRQIHCIDYMPWFNTEIIYTKGSKNCVADCLSHYYEREEGDSASDEEINWANTNMHLDLEGNNLLQDRWLELKVITIEGEPNPWKSKHFAEKWETHMLEAQKMASAVERKTEDIPHTNVEEDPTVFESAGTS